MDSGALDLPGKQGLLLRAALVLCLLWLPNEQAAAEFIHLPYSGHTFVDDEEISSSPDGIRIHVQKKLLRDVLQRIQNASGINFILYEDLFGVRITTRIKAADWTSAVRNLLENFSRVEVWGEDGGLGSVRLLKSEGYSTAPNQNTDWMIEVKPEGDKVNKASKRNKVKHVVRGRKFKIFLSEKELLEFIKAPADAPIPNYFTKDLLYRKFLEQFGFESIEDVFDIHNTRTVRLEVMRQLEELEKRNEEKNK